MRSQKKQKKNNKKKTLKKYNIIGGSGLLHLSRHPPRKIVITGRTHSPARGEETHLDEITGMFRLRFEKRSNFFDREIIYNPEFELDKVKTHMVPMELKEETIKILNNVKDNPNKKAHVINLHGCMVKERLHLSLPHNVIVCNMSSINTVNINYDKHDFSMGKFFEFCDKKTFDNLFKYRTLTAQPEDFEITKNRMTFRGIQMMSVIECFKKLNWIFPFQHYFDVGLSADDSINTLKEYEFIEEKKHKKTKQYEPGDITTLSAIVNEISTKNPNSMNIIVSASCLPYMFTVSNQDFDLSTLNFLFNHAAVLYDLNLSIDTVLNKETLGSDKKRYLHLKSSRGPTFCQGIDGRFMNLYAPNLFRDNHYLINPLGKKSDNMTRTYPFFQYIFDEMGKNLSRKKIQKYSKFFLGLSFNKKLKFYFKLMNELREQGQSNLKSMIKEVRKNSSFILNSLIIYENLLKIHKKKLFGAYDSHRATLKYDIGNFIHMLNLIFFQGKYDISLPQLVNSSLETLFFGIQKEHFKFFYAEVIGLEKPEPAIKNLKLLDVTLLPHDIPKIKTNLPNVIDIDFKDIKSTTSMVYDLSPRLEKIKICNSPNVIYSINPVPRAYANLTYCLLENITLARDIIFTDIPLATLVISDVNNLKVLLLQRLPNLNLLHLHLSGEVKIHFINVKTQKFFINYRPALKDLVKFDNTNFDIDYMEVKTATVMEKLVENTGKLTSQPIRNIKFSACLSEIDGLKEKLKKAITGPENPCFGGCTHLKLVQPQNLSEYMEFKKDPEVLNNLAKLSP